MKISILLFEKMAAQDAVGPYEAFRCVPGWEVVLEWPRQVDEGTR